MTLRFNTSNMNRYAIVSAVVKCAFVFVFVLVCTNFVPNDRRSPLTNDGEMSKLEIATKRDDCLASFSTVYLKEQDKEYFVHDAMLPYHRTND